MRTTLISGLRSTTPFSIPSSRSPCKWRSCTCDTTFHLLSKFSSTVILSYIASNFILSYSDSGFICSQSFWLPIKRKDDFTANTVDADESFRWRSCHVTCKYVTVEMYMLALKTSVFYGDSDQDPSSRVHCVIWVSSYSMDYNLHLNCQLYNLLNFDQQAPVAYE